MEKENAPVGVDGGGFDTGVHVAKKRKKSDMEWTQIAKFTTLAEVDTYMEQLAKEAGITKWIKGLTYRGKLHTFIDYRCGSRVTGCKVVLRATERGGNFFIEQTGEHDHAGKLTGGGPHPVLRPILKSKLNERVTAPKELLRAIRDSGLLSSTVLEPTKLQLRNYGGELARWTSVRAWPTMGGCEEKKSTPYGVVYGAPLSALRVWQLGGPAPRGLCE